MDVVRRSLREPRLGVGRRDGYVFAREDGQPFAPATWGTRTTMSPSGTARQRRCARRRRGARERLSGARGGCRRRVSSPNGRDRRIKAGSGGGSAARSLTISSVHDSGGASWPEPDLSTTSGLACRISLLPSSTTTTSCTYSASANGSRQAPEDHSTTGQTVLKAHNCSSTKQRNREPTRDVERAFITSHSWSRAERSSEKHTDGHVRAKPSSWTNHPTSLSMGNTVLRPTGLILMD